MNAGVLPIKPLDSAKSRLAERFGDDGRRAIAAALVEDALALCKSADFISWHVVTRDEWVTQRAHALGLATIADEGGGLNPALEHAATVLVRGGFDAMVVVPADVPLARAGDVADLVDTGATSDVVVVPSGDDGGTNALYVSPPGLIAPQFGPRSLHEHIARAEAAHHRCAILSLPRLALDIDSADDAEAFLARAAGAGSATSAVLARLLA